MMIGTELRGAQLLADLEPVELRQHDVEHDEIDRLLAEAAQRLLAVGRLDHLVAVALEREAQHLPDGLVVVDEQDGGGIGHVAGRFARLPGGVAVPAFLL